MRQYLPNGHRCVGSAGLKCAFNFVARRLADAAKALATEEQHSAALKSEKDALSNRLKQTFEELQVQQQFTVL